MNVDDATKLIDSISKLAASLAWPAVVAFVLMRFGPPLKDFIQSLGEVSFKGAGVEALLKRKQTEASAALAAATVARQDGEDRQSVAKEAEKAVNLVQDEVTPRVLRMASKATILWVDDNPDNNRYERRSLEALGLRFELAQSTEEALERIEANEFAAIISDMGRPPDQRAGYTLLNKLRASGNWTPYIIYAGSNLPEHRSEAQRRGALGSTNRPSELFEYVLQALSTGA